MFLLERPVERGGRGRRPVRHQDGAERVRRLHRSRRRRRATLSPRSVAIVTFALCGFANFSSIAIQMAVTGGLAPNQRPMIAKLGLKALLAGSLVQSDERGAGRDAAPVAGRFEGSAPDLIWLDPGAAAASPIGFRRSSRYLSRHDRPCRRPRDRLRLAHRRGPRSRRLCAGARRTRSSATASPSSPITAFPADLIARAEEKAKAFFALPEEVKRAYHHRRRRRRARLHAVRHRDRQGRDRLRPQGILARRPRAAAGPPLSPS